MHTSFFDLLVKVIVEIIFIFLVERYNQKNIFSYLIINKDKIT